MLDGSLELQTCTVESGCLAGVSGVEQGQFGGESVQGVTVDSAGDVYVADVRNSRVQKFDLSGAQVQFVVMFGGGVNKTKVEEPGATEAERNLCPVDPGDVCQAGVAGTGNGQFGWPASGLAGDFIAASPDGEAIYVGDLERIQKFDKEGDYLEDLPDPDEVLSGNAVQSLAIDPSGSFFLTRCPGSDAGCHTKTFPGVVKLSSAGAELCTLAGVVRPNAVATGAGNVYVVGARVPGTPPPAVMEIIEYDSSSCAETNRWNAEEEGFSTSTGIATSTACGIAGTDLLISNSNFSDSFIGLYGPPPDPDVCPPPLIAPTISDQYAVSVGSDGATVRAAINPHFWPDTRLYVEYGTGKCSEGNCLSQEPLPPGALLTTEVKDAPITSAGIFLGGLEPSTTYHYRFVAESSGGGPTIGAEATFTTLPLAPKAKTDCPNQALRTGLSGHLPDCRAYEMVSPLDKENGDIATTGSAVFQMASLDGNRATYTSVRAFADPEASPLANQYLSSRDPADGWLTRSISPPRTSLPLYEPGASSAQFKAFSEDLCSGWFIQDTDLALAPGAPPGVPNFYRRDDRECGEEGYQLITTAPPPGFSAGAEPLDSLYFPQVQGISADSSQTLLRANAVLTPNACKTTPGTEEGKGIYQLYLHDGDPGGGLHLVSVLPSGKAACVHSSGGTAQGAFTAFREDSVLNALSADGSRVFWLTSAKTGPTGNEVPVREGGNGQQPGPLYLRLNPAAPQSMIANGIGDLSNGSNEVKGLEAAKGKGTLTAGSDEVTALETTAGQFVVGQPISGTGIPAGTTILSVSPTTLTLSAPATASGTNVTLLSKGPLPFAVGQEISGEGIPIGAEIIAVAEGVLTLSANATVTKFNAALSAGSCEAEKACTLPVSLAADTRFHGADPTGATAIYSAGGGLFEYDAATQASDSIAPSGLLGVMGMSADASRVYFVSSAVLTGDEENSEGEKAAAGQPNLYLHERGAGATFVAGLAAIDVFGVATTGFEPPSPIAALPDLRLSRVSGDGLHATFVSAASLTGYDNRDAEGGAPDGEVYLFDAAPGAAGELNCISCNPTGARPRGRVVFAGIRQAARIPGWTYQLYPSRVLSNDGDRLFFESFEALVLRDTNGKQDVYEWERASSAKECEQVGAELYVASSGGCLSLISSGKSSIDSHFIDASASGSDVFFSTAASLLPQDFGLVDVYEAREGGGFPPPPVPVPPCEGEACQPASAPPQAPTPASSAVGKGNTPPEARRRRCPKGKRRVVRRGKARCVKKRKGGKRSSRRGRGSK